MHPRASLNQSSARRQKVILTAERRNGVLHRRNQLLLFDACRVDFQSNATKRKSCSRILA